MEGLTASQDELFTINIYDGTKIDSNQLIFTGNEEGLDAAFSIKRTIHAMGQTWTIVWKSTPEF